MKIFHNGDLYRVVFKHTTGPWFNLKTRKTEERKLTICDIQGQESEGFWCNVSRGFAWCSPQDPYCKETGRKLSLTEALQKAFAYRETRRKFWEEYAKQTKKDWYKSNKEKIFCPDLRPLREGRLPQVDCNTGVVVQRMFQQGEINP